ncbi:hypothetical protein F4703DRAFT_1826200 [Phycomyces blakesleeanus]
MNQTPYSRILLVSSRVTFRDIAFDRLTIILACMYAGTASADISIFLCCLWAAVIGLLHILTLMLSSLK